MEQAPTPTPAAAAAAFPPVCMPKAIIDLGSRKFHELRVEQRERVIVNSSERIFEHVGVTYSQFRDKYNNNQAFQKAVDATENAKTFSEAWRGFYKEFRSLATFAIGLASIFPGTSAVESDFSVIGIEKDAHRKRLANLSLEGILQTKQRSELNKLQKELDSFIL